MNHQLSHESEWLRQLRQKEEGMRREIVGTESAAALMSSINETQSEPRAAQAAPRAIGAVVYRLARICAANLRRPAGAAPRS